ncbi:MAG: nitrilase family protein [Saprospiraceae bacterium]|nr:nitrilase family protein [Saprospiraceae bacterium]
MLAFFVSVLILLGLFYYFETCFYSSCYFIDYDLSRLKFYNSVGDLRITLCQSDIIWEQAEANCLHLDLLFDNLKKDETDLIILPEMFLTGFSMNSKLLAEPILGPGFQWMKKLAQMKNAAVTGSLIIEEEGKFYNRLLWIEPEKEMPEFYNKKHLFTLAGEQNHYNSGNQKLIVSYKDWKISFFICYDLRFPVWSRNTDAVDLIIYVANFPERREQAWNCLLPARAIENQCYVAGVNRVGLDENDIKYRGDSAVYNFEGSKILDLEDREQWLTSTLDSQSLKVYKRAYPFLKDRDLFDFN